MTSPPLQRLRIWYRKTEAAEALQPGQVGRAWVEALTAAGMAPARPEGSRRPRIEMGPPLPQGVTGEREPFDVWLAEAVPVADVPARLAEHAPPGLEPVEAEEVGAQLPSLGASVRAATYRVQLPPHAGDAAALAAGARALLEAETLRWVEVRGERVREVDLRSLVLALEVAPHAKGAEVRMKLVHRQEQAGRPSSVLAALGVDGTPVSVVRTAVEVDRPRVALRAWRRAGRFE